MRKFRILALDGGGIRGAYTASVLAALESASDQRCQDYFDLIVGTSTGGIVAVGLGLGLTAADIRDFYLKKGNLIFPSTGVASNLLLTIRQVLKPRRRTDLLRDSLRVVFQDRLFGESTRALVIPTYDAVAGRIFLFKTRHHPRFRFDGGYKAVDVALATSAAPTYFEAKTFSSGATFVDGGVWANCPALVGLTEALAFFDVPPQEVDILSVGTTSEPFSIGKSKRRGGVLAWNITIVKTLMNAQAESALAQVSLITGGGIHRIDCRVESGRFGMDDARSVGDLVALGEGEARKKEHLDAVSGRFLTGKPAPATKFY